MLIVKAKVKETVSQHGDFSVAADVAEVLEKKAQALLAEACERAKANNRKTVMGRDL